MKHANSVVITTLLCFLPMVSYMPAAAESPEAYAGSSCESLKALRIPDTTIKSAEMVENEWREPSRGGGPGGQGDAGMRALMGEPPAGRGAGEPPVGRGVPQPARSGRGPTVVKGPFCRVVGVVDPAINFEVWLPPVDREKKWNGKFNGVGNGGLAGSINYRSMAQALARGYATASTDTGHVQGPENESWPMDNPALLTDFASRSIHMMTRAAKQITAAYYGNAPKYSYFTGCSGGGGQAMSEAQRYPADYDGICAGAPAMFPTRMWPGELHAAWVTHRDPSNMIPGDKLTLINNAALAACDAQDGVKDGVLDDPTKCNFDPSTLLCKGADGPNCLTAAQVDSVKKIYEGLREPNGKQYWPPYEIGSEPFWPGHINEPFGVPISYFKYMVLRNPKWDWHAFDFADPKNFAIIQEASARLGPILDSMEPDLSAFQKLGGKLILYHGWYDQNIAPRNSVNYYQKVVETMGGEGKTKDFFRLFMAPGMGHCGGGPGPSVFDALAALEQWVESGKAPDRLLASRVSNGKVDRTRPLCAYPLVAKYRGKGSTDEAASFECRLP